MSNVSMLIIGAGKCINSNFLAQSRVVAAPFKLATAPSILVRKVQNYHEQERNYTSACFHSQQNRDVLLDTKSNLSIVGNPCKYRLTSLFPWRLQAPYFQQSQLIVKLNRSYCSSAADQSYDLSYEQLMERIKSGNIQLFDVRRQEETEQTGMMPKATNIPLSEIEEAFQLLPEEFQTRYGVKMPEKGDTDIVLHCLGGVRSLKALTALHSLGFDKAKHFPGGWEVYEEVTQKS